MKHVFRFFRTAFFSVTAACLFSMPCITAQETTTPAATDQAALNTQAAAAISMGYKPVVPDFIEQMADSLLGLFNIRSSGNSWERFALAASVLVVFYILRRLFIPLVFKVLHNFVERVSKNLGERLVTAIETPLAMFIMVAGVYVALNTLKHPPDVGEWIRNAAKLLFAVTSLWLAVRVVCALFDFAQDKAKEHESPIAAFMPWIRKASVAIFTIVGALVIAQSLGFNVQTFIAGLGIGGLAFALAAQDTIANVFGAAVVAIDQPFKLGDTVQLAGHIGTVEDIGVRSMKLRRPDKALVVIPNKTVASESIINLSKFTNRRVEQVIGFTYDSTPEQMEAIVGDVRALIAAEHDVLPDSGMVYFRDFNASSLDLWVVYITKEPDFQKHMALRQRLNLAFMHAAQARGLSFAFPTQTIDFGPSAAKLLGRKE